MAACLSRVRRLLAATALALAGAAQAQAPDPAQSRIALPLPDGSAITAHWLPRDGERRPAVVALHGCGGLFRRDGKRFDDRYPDYVARLHAAGFHVLLPDSFTARGERSICAQKNVTRGITVDRRRHDAAAAVGWAAAQPQVDSKQVVLLGWSHGAMTTLAAIDGSRSDAARPVAAAVVFYPGCSALLKRDFRVGQPLLMLLGAADDWTPPARCEQLVARTRAAQPEADITLRVYEGAYHGFDGRGPLRFRADVPNGVDPGGVHAGGNPAARAAALDELDRFLARIRQ